MSFVANPVHTQVQSSDRDYCPHIYGLLQVSCCVSKQNVQGSKS